MKLTEAVKVGAINMPNRIVMAPLTRCRADNIERVPTELHAVYYSQRAGAGLIISEGTVVSPMGIGYVNTPGIYSDLQVEGWKKVTSAVHLAGGRIFCQLWHVGRISHPDFHQGELPLAPSAINPGGIIKTPLGRKEMVAPAAMNLDQIASTIDDFRNAGANAMEAGFDGVEIHSSNGYLIHQFFSKSSNIRRDNYGGSIENRTRFFFELLDAVTSVIPNDRIGARLNPMLHNKSGISIDDDTLGTFEQIVLRLNEYQLAYLHLTRPFFPVESPRLPDDVPRHFRPLSKGHLMVNGGYDKSSAEAELERGNADSVSFGRPFIANPDLPDRIAKQQAWAEADPDKFYTAGADGYTTYPDFDETKSRTNS